MAAHKWVAPGPALVSSTRSGAPDEDDPHAAMTATAATRREAQTPRIEPMAWWEGSSSRKERPVGMMKKLFLLGVGGAAGKVLLDKRRGTQRESGGPNAGVAGVVDTPTGTDPNAKYTAAGFEDKSIGQAVNQDAELAERLLAESDGDTAEAERRFQEESAGAPKLQAQARDTEPG
jgi:hypothetical protein